MKLALSNIAIENGSEEAAYALLQKYGFTGLEVAPTRLVGEAPYSEDKTAAAKAEATRLAAQYGLCVPSMQSIWYGCTENVFDPDGAHALTEYTAGAVRFAAAVGCPSLVLGCPRNRSVPTGALPQQAQPFYAAIASLAHAAGTAIALEANPPLYNTNFVNDTAAAFAYAATVPYMTVNYDLGTCIINGESLDALAANLAMVSHVHISEPGLAPIENRALHQELAALLRKGGYAQYVSIEMKAQPLPVLEQTLQYVSEVFA